MGKGDGALAHPWKRPKVSVIALKKLRLRSHFEQLRRDHLEGKIVFKKSLSPGLCSRPSWGAYNAPPDPLAGG